jgi:gas vesicle protein
MSRKNNTGGKIALSAMVAGVAGYVAGILTAPKSGKETRTDVTNKASNVKAGAEKQLQDSLDDLNQTVDAVKKKSLALSSKAKDEYDETMVKAKDAQNKAGQVLKAVKAGEASDPDLNKAVKQASQAAKNLKKYLKS